VAAIFVSERTFAADEPVSHHQIGPDALARRTAARLAGLPQAPGRHRRRPASRCGVDLLPLGGIAYLLSRRRRQQAAPGLIRPAGQARQRIVGGAQPVTEGGLDR
jgi:hypothetical protein